MTPAMLKRGKAMAMSDRVNDVVAEARRTGLTIWAETHGDAGVDITFAEGACGVRVTPTGYEVRAAAGPIACKTTTELILKAKDVAKKASRGR